MAYATDSINGISGEFSDGNVVLQNTLIIFIAISFYNIIELVVLVLSTFRRRSGLYFWSLLVSGCLGVVPYSLGFLMKFVTRINSYVSVTVLTIGWWAMVTGQSFVLYSRLHLVLRDERTLRHVLHMIIANFFLLQVPTTVLTYGSNVKPAGSAFVRGYNIMEKIQLTGFTIQEGIISGLYVYETVKLLRLGSDRGRRRIMHQLVGINVSMFIMDLVLLGLEYASLYAAQITLKGAIYSVKLKLEFAVLGKLVDMVHRNRRPAGSLPLCSLDPAAGVPSGSPGDPSFYGVSSAAAQTRPINSTDDGEYSNVPDGKILAMTEFSTWVENRPGGNNKISQ